MIADFLTLLSFPSHLEVVLIGSGNDDIVDLENHAAQLRR